MSTEGQIVPDRARCKVAICGVTAWPGSTAVCHISCSPVCVCAAVAAPQGLLEDLREACRGCSAAFTAAVAFLDSRQLGMVSLLDRQAKELLLQVQVSARLEE